jgi:hypothetical protein
VGTAFRTFATGISDALIDWFDPQGAKQKAKSEPKPQTDAADRMVASNKKLEEQNEKLLGHVSDLVKLVSLIMLSVKDKDQLDTISGLLKKYVTEMISNNKDFPARDLSMYAGHNSWNLPR